MTEVVSSGRPSTLEKHPDARTTTTLKTLQALDYSCDQLAKFVSVSGDNERLVVTIPTEIQVQDLVQHLDSICCQIMAEWQSLKRNCSESMANFSALLASLLRVLANLTFLFDNDKYPEHTGVPKLCVASQRLNEHIVHMCLSWVLDLRIRDYKHNETGSTLTNVMTLLHNYVSYEFAEENKQFCTLLLAHSRLPAFLCVTAEIVVGRVGTDLALRTSLQQVCVKFWNAVVNWNITEEKRYKELRNVFADHLKLQELMEAMIKRFEARDEEAIYFVAMLFDSDKFMTRFLSESFDDVRKKFTQYVVAECADLLEAGTMENNSVVLFFEILISIGSSDPGRDLLLGKNRESFMAMVHKFVVSFDRIVTAGGNRDDFASVGAKKLLGVVFRSYGVLHEPKQIFLDCLLDKFGNESGLLQLRAHLKAFHAHPLLREDETIETEDVDRFYRLFMAVKKRLQDRGLDRNPNPIPVLSRTATERFKAITPGPFRVPYPVAMSAEFAGAVSASLNEPLLQDEEGGSRECGMAVEDGLENEHRAEVHGPANERSEAGQRESSSDEEGEKRMKRMPESNDSESDREHKRARTGSAEELSADPPPGGSSTTPPVGAPAKSDGGEQLKAESLDSGAHPNAAQEQVESDDFHMSSPEFIDPAEYESDTQESEVRVRCRVVVGDGDKTLSKAAATQSNPKSDSQQLNFDFKAPMWSAAKPLATAAEVLARMQAAGASAENGSMRHAAKKAHTLSADAVAPGSPRSGGKDQAGPVSETNSNGTVLHPRPVQATHLKTKAPPAAIVQQLGVRENNGARRGITVCKVPSKDKVRTAGRNCSKHVRIAFMINTMQYRLRRQELRQLNPFPQSAGFPGRSVALAMATSAPLRPQHAGPQRAHTLTPKPGFLVSPPSATSRSIAVAGPVGSGAPVLGTEPPHLE